MPESDPILRAELKVLETRIEATDRAATVFAENLNRVPTLLDREMLRVVTLFTEQLAGFRALTDERFAAQEKAATARDASNDKAIQKSEHATGEAIRSLTIRFDDLKDRVISAEGKSTGATSRSSMLVTIAALGIAALSLIAGYVRAVPSVPTPVPAGYVLTPAPR